MNNTHEDQGQIPESSSFIPESTLIPHSEQMLHVPETGERKYSSDDGGLPGGNSKGLKAANQNRPSFIKRNLPLVVFVVAVTGIGGSVAYKKLHTSAAARNDAQNQMAQAEQPVIAAPVTQPEVIPAPMPVPSIPTVEVAPPAPEPVVKVTQKEVVTSTPLPVMKAVQIETAAPVKLQLPLPTPVAKQTTQTTTVTVTDPVKSAGVVASTKPAKVSVETSENGMNSAVTVIQTPDASPKQSGDLVGNTAKTHEDNPAAKKRIAQLKSELGQAQTRITELESALQTEKVRPRATADATPALPKTARKAHRAARYVSNKRHDPRRHVAQERAGGFSISAVRNGLAWIDTPNGLITVREGDFVPGFGRVARIDEHKMRVSSGNRFIE